MKRKNWRLLAVLALALSLIAAACGGDDDDDTTATTAAAGATETTAAGDPVASGETLKVAFVNIGPASDQGWNWAHDQGRQFIEAELGDAVEVTFLENIPEGPDSQRTFEQLAADGNTLIFGTSFGYMDPMLEAAKAFPDVVFMHNTGFKTSENMGNYFGAAEEGRYLTGLAAGAATESNLIGYVAAFPIPEVIRGINAFTIGVREVNPDAQVEVVWTSTWFDPPKEGTAAQSLLDKGADVIAMHQDSTAPGQAADTAGAKWVGYNTDRSDFAPEAWLTAPIWNWGPFYLKTVQEVISGAWTSEAYYGNMADGMVELGSFGPSVSDETKALIAERQAAIIDGSFSVFSDPIVDQDGTERPLGNIFTDEHNWFVEGVVGSPTG
jgi:basic membrane protein A